MAVLPFCPMTYMLIGNMVNKWIKAAMPVPLFPHYILHWRWRGGSRGGEDMVLSACTVNTLLLLFAMFSLMVNNVILSRKVFAFLPIQERRGSAKYTGQTTAAAKRGARSPHRLLFLFFPPFFISNQWRPPAAYKRFSAFSRALAGKNGGRPLLSPCRRLSGMETAVIAFLARQISLHEADVAAAVQRRGCGSPFFFHWFLGPFGY